MRPIILKTRIRARVAHRAQRAARIIRALKTLFPRAETVLRYRTLWELLVSVVLSAQCTDKKVNEVTRRLFKKYRSLDDYVRASRSVRTIREFERDIRQTGFYRMKAKHILAAARVVREKFHGTLPRTLAQMVTIPGIGRKSANVILGNAYGVVEGIAVDTHVIRLSRVLGLSLHTNPDKIEQDLMALVPKREWFALTNRLIAYGRKYCGARAHNHTACPLREFHVHV